MTQMPFIRAVLPAFSVSIFLMMAPMVAGDAFGAPSAWRDPANGFAIGGYDPVAYFTQHNPTPGQEGIEHSWGGVNWRFVNTGNRDAFAKHPSVYAPQFAGYDAIALSKGLTVQGSPTLWVVHQQRTYLFSDRANLGAWKLNRDKILLSARAKWNTLGGNLSGTSENKTGSENKPKPDKKT